MNRIVNIILGYYQIYGGIVGVILALFLIFTVPFSIMNLLLYGIFLFYVFSIISGSLLILNKYIGLSTAMIIQILQIPILEFYFKYALVSGFQIAPLIYISPEFKLGFAGSMTSEFLLLLFPVMIEKGIGINLVPCMILIYLLNEKHNQKFKMNGLFEEKELKYFDIDTRRSDYNKLFHHLKLISVAKIDRVKTLINNSTEEGNRKEILFNEMYKEFEYLLIECQEKYGIRAARFKIFIKDQLVFEFIVKSNNEWVKVNYLSSIIEEDSEITLTVSREGVLKTIELD